VKPKRSFPRKRVLLQKEPEMKKLVLATACLVLLVIASTGAWANATGPQVTLSKGTAGLYSFWGTSGQIDFTLTGLSSACGHANCVSGSAALDDGLGNLTGGKYWMWLTGGPPNLTGGPNNFVADMGTSTLYMQVGLGPHGDGTLGQIYGTVALTGASGGGTSTPTFNGMFTTITTSGALSLLFPAGSRTELDFTLNLGPATTFVVLQNGPTISGYVSSGELTPTPEPGTLALMGTGVLGLAGAIRRRLR
jgi:PEP-CTERM motif